LKNFISLILILFLFGNCTKKVVGPDLFVGDITAISLGTNDTSLEIPVFADSKHGLIYSYDSGELFRTSDGGDTWSLSFNANAIGTILNIQYPNADTAYFTIPDYTVHHSYCYRSTDGCATWTPVFTLNENCHLSYCDGKNGFAVSAIPPSTTIKLLKTTNAGNNWAISGSLPAPNTASIQFINPTTCFATAGGFQYCTTNAGTTWNPIGQYQVNSRLSKTGTSFRTNTNDRGIYKTTDLGNNWTQVWTDSGHNFSCVDFSDDGIVCASQNDCLMISTDSGQTWHFYQQKEGANF
jgi:photosystem II stability/assembly factor-like uncharacterized protein